jgi:hypothetical protein
MTRTAESDDSHLILRLGSGAYHYVLSAELHEILIGHSVALEELFGNVIGVVDEFVH